MCLWLRRECVCKAWSWSGWGLAASQVAPESQQLPGDKGWFSLLRKCVGQAAEGWAAAPRSPWPRVLLRHCPTIPGHGLLKAKTFVGVREITSIFQRAEKRKKRRGCRSLPFCFYRQPFWKLLLACLHISARTSRPGLRGPALAAERLARVLFSAGRKSR